MYLQDTWTIKVQYMFTNYIYFSLWSFVKHMDGKQKTYLKNQQGSTSSNVILQNLAIFQQEWVDF